MNNPEQKFREYHGVNMPISRIPAIILLVGALACAYHAMRYDTYRITMIVSSIINLICGVFCYRVTIGDRPGKPLIDKSSKYQNIESWAHQSDFMIRYYWLSILVSIAATICLLWQGRGEIIGAWAMPMANIMFGGFAILCIGGRRNIYCLLVDEKIVVSSYFGSIREIPATSVYRMEHIMQDNIRVLDIRGLRLFEFYESMENSREFSRALRNISKVTNKSQERRAPVVMIRKPEITKTDEIEEDIKAVKATVERIDRTKQIREILWTVTLGSIAIAIGLMQLRKGGIISLKMFVGITQLLFASLLLFPIIFKNHIKWVDPDVGKMSTNRDLANEDRWNKVYITMTSPIMFILIPQLLLSRILMDNINIIKGGMPVWLVGVTLYFAYIVISMARIGKDNFRAEELGWCMLLTALIFVGITETSFFVLSGKPYHQDIVIKEIVCEEGKYKDDYYATVNLNGKNIELNISHSSYGAAQRGERMVLCTRNSIFGVEIAGVHPYDEEI